MKTTDRRLLGTWKSDRHRTLKDCRRYHGLKGAKRRQFAELFGHLDLRYTRKFVYHRLRDFCWRERYEVVAQDAESIVIRIHADEMKKRVDSFLVASVPEFFLPRLLHVHFRRVRGRQFYWIGLGRLCEWFQKVDPR